jgi:hypothetical protein
MIQNGKSIRDKLRGYEFLIMCKLRNTIYDGKCIEG